MGTYWAGGSGWVYPNYVIGIIPYNSTDALQMVIVQKYNTLSSTCSNATIIGFENAPLGAAANVITFSTNPFSDNTLITFNINSGLPITVGKELSAGVYIVLINTPVFYY